MDRLSYEIKLTNRLGNVRRCRQRLENGDASKAILDLLWKTQLRLEKENEWYAAKNPRKRKGAK